MSNTRVYASNSKYMKDPNFFSTSGGISEALPALVHPEYHRQRRKMVNNLFSARNIEELAPIVIDVIRRALVKATEAHEQSKPLDIQRLYTGVTVRRPAAHACNPSKLMDIRTDRYNHASAL